MSENNGVKRQKIYDFFNNGNIYNIPQYQRKYVWNPINNVEPLLEEIKGLIENKTETLYLGNILINSDKNGKQWLIDGQQRVTTFMLFFKALLDHLFENEDDYYGLIETNEKKLEEFIYMFEKSSGIREKRLKLSDLLNKEEFIEIFQNNWKNKDIQKIPWKNKSNFHRNYAFIRWWLKYNENEFDINDILDSLKKIWIIKIYLQKNDDELKIFETLNSKGTPLEAIDLIKNFYFINLRKRHIYENDDLSNEVTKLFDKELWNKMEDWGEKKSLDKEKELKKIIKEYTIYKSIRNNQTMTLPEEKNIPDLYNKFKRVIEEGYAKLKKRKDIENSLNDLKRFITIKSWVKSFKKLNKSKLENWEQSLMLFNDLYTGSQFFPIIIQLVDSMVELDIFNKPIKISEEFKKSILFLEKIIVVRNFSGLGTRLITRTINKIKINSFDDLKKEFNNYDLIPSDNRFREELKNHKINRLSKGILKPILWIIELRQYKTNTEKIINIINDSKRKKITIEHIMPKELNKSWIEQIRNSYSYTEKKDLERIYEDNLEKLGNVTLNINNSQLSDKSFEEKKKIYRKDIIQMNRKISKNAHWTEKEIEKRSNQLEDIIYDIWKFEK